MQASWCPKLPGDNKRFCLWAGRFLAVFFSALRWKEQSDGLLQWSKTCCVGWSCWKPPRGEPSPFRSSWKGAHHWAPCCPQTFPGPPACCSSWPCQPARLAVALVPCRAVWPWLAKAFLIAVFFNPACMNTAGQDGDCMWSCTVRYKGVVNFGRRVVTSYERTWGGDGTWHLLACISCRQSSMSNCSQSRLAVLTNSASEADH